MLFWVLTGYQQLFEFSAASLPQVQIGPLVFHGYPRLFDLGTWSRHTIWVGNRIVKAVLAVAYWCMLSPVSIDKSTLDPNIINSVSNAYIATNSNDSETINTLAKRTDIELMANTQSDGSMEHRYVDIMHR